MRLIDADKLPYIKAPIAPILVGDEVVWCNIVYKLHIDNAPTVNAVPVVRCRDCTKREICRTSNTWAVAPSDDWYCADGERKGGDE